MKFAHNIFKAYDIRGLSPEELNPPVAHAVGRALADFLPAGKVGVGRDMRADSAELAEAVRAGLLQQGREVIDLGLITSDMMYFGVGSLELAGGAMVTASHNPGRYDGIKLTGPGVVPIGVQSGLLEIEKDIQRDQFKLAHNDGKIEKKDITAEWLKHALSVAGAPGDLNIGIDFGNGMASILLPELKKQTDLKIESLFAKLDGSFPNHVANPLEPKNTVDLRKLVVEKKLDCGLAFDGDGDRAFFCDESGKMLSGSVLGILLAQHILTQNPGATILYNAVSSRLVAEVVEAAGGKAIRTRVGHSYIKADMRRHGAAFALEHSGHFYFAENYFADSGLIAALMLLHILSKSGSSLSELVAPLRGRYFQSGELNIKTSNAPVMMKKIHNAFPGGKADHLDGLTLDFKDWWLNARASNTEPYIRVNIEATSQAKLSEILQKMRLILGRS